MNEELPVHRDFNVQVPPELSGGEYANAFRVTQNPGEFILDFCRKMPEEKNPALVNRIILSPHSAVAFLLVLQRAVSDYKKSTPRDEDIKRSKF